jgi:dipeptidyl aminopeptidase/acylaminoacyl peptidase
MKLTMITAGLAFALSACVSNNLADTQADTQVKAENSPAAQFSTVHPSQESMAGNGNVISLEQIMSDPDWIARSPSSWYWGDDNANIFYQQKRQGQPLYDLYQKQLSTPGNGEAVALSDLHLASDRYASKNQAGTHKVYSFKGNVFVKEIQTGQVVQLTYTSAVEYDAMFLNNDQVAYRIANVFYMHNRQTNQIIELANLQMADKPKGIAEPSSYIAKEQHKLINYVALQQTNAKLREQKKKKLQQQNTSITDTNYYFGKDNELVHASLSPQGDKLIVSLAKVGEKLDGSDIMPNYIAKDGHIKAQKVRRRVADNRQYQEELFLLDLTTKQKSLLAYDSLPGFDQDVLASVRKENFARAGEIYTSEKKARHIHVMSAERPILWQKNGQQLAVMLEAWDNKDRWIATVDLTKATLVSQHRLHDDAWINWSFNEFGWLEQSNRLYYLSEQSGYSHLYVKGLGQKAVALTSGQYEVQDLTLSHDQSTLYFKANRKHPGIYEIYQLDIATGDVIALTDLGGMNNYALSPDESSLLIQHSTVTMPPELYVQDAQAGASAKRITHTVSQAFMDLPWSAPAVIAIESSHQDQPIFSRVYFPKDFDKTTQKNRAVMFTHGAGYLQNAHLGWSGYFREFMFHSMLVQQGYVVIDMDYRASQGYGRDWRTSIYRQMGTPEVQDMRDGVNWLVDNANVDKERIGTYGGSYGGFLTLMSMFKEPDLFASGSAIRLVSDWAYYNHGYTSNILNTPEDDPIAFERSSPIYFAEGLQKPLLINAPMVDDNVFFQDTVRLVQRLIELEKEDFETAIYPVEPHGFVQPSSWLNEYRRIYKLFETTLKK